ncbi:MAG: ROK family transcriptional regulator [Burkholderiales bacterium]|nr:MAG: ROK family transcriptional regulator [Burkholderiales bacterium]
MVIKSPALGAPSSLRRVHRSLALREIFHAPGISRVELADRLGLSSMAIGRIVRELWHAGLIGETEPAGVALGRGRPASSLELLGDGAFVVGVVLSAYAQEATLLDLRGQAVANRPIQLDDISDGERTVAQTCAAIDQLIDAAGVDRRRVAGVGFCVAANVDTERRLVMGGGYLGWEPLDLGASAARALALPVSVEKVADTLIRAESFFGCARESRAVVLLHAATTLGMSFSFNGERFHGAHFHAGRIGHFPARRTRLICSCGQSNCLNCSASGWSVLAQLGVLDSPAYRPEQVRHYAREIHKRVDPAAGGEDVDARTARVLGKAGAALAQALVYLELTFDPDLVILAGSLARNEAYFTGFLEALRAAAPSEPDTECKIVRGGITPVHGAGLVALLDHVLSPSLDLRGLAGEAFDDAEAAERRGHG